LEKSLAEGSQTFEDDIARLIAEGTITRDEGLAQADSPTNLLWRLQNTSAAASRVPVASSDMPEDTAAFWDYTIDVTAPFTA
jgi:twitching motility protein PilU